MPTALITGITGQDGSYLAELLLEKGYRVVGTILPSGEEDLARIRHILPDLMIAPCDLLDARSVEQTVGQTRPDEVYNLAARASGEGLFSDPVLTGNVNGLAVMRLLEALRAVRPEARFCQASSSEMFGNPREVPQTEDTPLRPENPYGAAKAYAHWVTGSYRRHRGLFACSAVLYNHESPRRGPEFVTRKVSLCAARIRLGREADLPLGNLEARRDWGFAGDYVRAMWLMLQQDRPDDYVIATGETHSVGELCETAFRRVGLDYRSHVVRDPASSRPPEPSLRVGDPSRARRILGWTPSVTFRELIHMMVDSDMAQLSGTGRQGEG